MARKKCRVGVKKFGELYYATIGKRIATWKDFGEKRAGLKKTPAVYQTKKAAQKDIKRLKKLVC